MLTLIIGGSASGKSEYAESLVIKNDTPRYYIATMQPFDDESVKRIEKHREMRRLKKFDTIECYTGLENVELPQNGTVLLECMSNLTANEMFSPNGAGEQTVEKIMCGVNRLKKQCGNLIIVSNEVFSGGNDYEGDTDKYLRFLALVNIRIAEIADNVCEIICGMPYYHKGSEPI